MNRDQGDRKVDNHLGKDYFIELSGAPVEALYFSIL